MDRVKRLLFTLLPAVYSALVLIAYGGVRPNCWSWLIYEPVAPRALRK
ncbi:MAG: cyclic lactone autoinducer peptide [Ammonifex sp.]|nr:MAG: cyclic lactone autoinducer peptide [Ammonifex sp.]